MMNLFPRFGSDSSLHKSRLADNKKRRFTFKFRLTDDDFKIAYNGQIIIVGSGPHGADPHHECSDRELRSGDIVVVDIGGPYEPGYNSDSTRTYSIGEHGPDIARSLVGAILNAGARKAICLQSSVFYKHT